MSETKTAIESKAGAGARKPKHIATGVLRRAALDRAPGSDPPKATCDLKTAERFLEDSVPWRR